MLYLIGEIIIFLLLAFILGAILGALLRGSGNGAWRRESARLRQRIDEVEGGHRKVLDAAASLRTRLEALEAHSVQFGQQMEEAESNLAALGEFKNLFQALNQTHAREKSRVDALQIKSRELESKLANLKRANVSSGKEPPTASTADWAEEASGDVKPVASPSELASRLDVLSESSETLMARLDALEQDHAEGDWSPAVERIEKAHAELLAQVETIRRGTAKAADGDEVRASDKLNGAAHADHDDGSEAPADDRVGDEVSAQDLASNDESTEEAAAEVAVSTAPKAEEPTDDGADEPKSEEAAVVSTPSASHSASTGGRDRDNLKRIRGIGRVIERILNEAGVRRFEQIAAWSDQDLAHYADLLGEFSGRIERDNWIEQARQLIEGKAPRAG